LRALTSCGWPLSRLDAEDFAIATRCHSIVYRQPALLGDEIELITWLSDVRETTAVRHTTIARTEDGAEVSRARTVHAWVDRKTGQPTAIPAVFLADVALSVAE